jgi:hypothetical protein
MKSTCRKKNMLSMFARIAIVSIIPVALVATTARADITLTLATPITLAAPVGLPGVAPLPFTGVNSGSFTMPATMLNMKVTPNQGVSGSPMIISGTGLPTNAALTLTWSTAIGNWLVDVVPSTVNYRGASYTKFNVNIGIVTTDSNGAFSYSTTIPEDFGGVHDIYAVQNGAAVAHAGYQMNRVLTISPKSGPVGTPITITYTSMGASLYTGGAEVLWDNRYTGEMQAQWTRGTGKVVIRAAGTPGLHYVQVANGIGYMYMNVIQSPVPYTNGGTLGFRITKDNGPSASYITWPAQVQPTVNERTTLSAAGLDPDSKAVASLSVTSGPVLTKTTISATGLLGTGVRQLVWSTVVGNRVNCLTTCWAFNSIPLGSATIVDGAIKADITVPDHLGGWHVVQVLNGDKVEAQVPFYTKESLVPFYDKSGKLLSMGLAAADISFTPEALAAGQSGVGKTSFKNGEEFTISVKGVGWTHMDNTLAVTYDNSYIGYSCGFNSNGYMVVHLRAIGNPGTHLIDLYPLLYTNSPSFPNTPYGMLPVLSADRDFPGLALGYQVPSMHFAITITR